MRPDIAVIGGGLTGLMMARALSATGAHILLVDRSSGADSIPDERTTTINAAGMRMLQTLGVQDNLQQDATPIMRIAVAEGAPLSGLAARRRPNSDLSWQAGDTPMAYVVGNADLQSALTRTLGENSDFYGSIEILSGATLTGMARHAGGMQLDIEDAGGQLSHRSADLVVACDGNNSKVAGFANLAARQEQTFQTAIVSILRAERDHENTAFQRFLPTGPFALMPMSGQHLSLVWTLPDDTAQTLLAADEQAFEAACLDAFGQSLGYLHLAGQRLAWPLRPSLRRRIAAAGVVLAGDAAHALHPIAGQGYNLALADAAVLADCLALARTRGLSSGHPSIWQSYEAARRTERLAMSAATSGINQLFARSPAFVRRMAGAGFAVLDKTPVKSVFSRIAEGGELADAALLRGQFPGTEYAGDS
jgi:ubiquinone biosynthesis UbiH/UbiF/VisC/COQ6 family hydroxylase